MCRSDPYVLFEFNSIEVLILCTSPKLKGKSIKDLTPFLLEKGYEVHGTIRRVALEDPEHRLVRIRHISDKLVLHAASLDSYASIFNVLQKVNPHECYHLAAQSFVSYSFEDEFSTLQTNINGTHYVLSSIVNNCPDCRFYFAGSSEMFGNAKEVPQNENTPFNPRSPYGISKLAGFHLTKNYREAHNLYALSGILFNHESPRRGFEFVTRKVTSAAARIKLGLDTELRLGTLEAKRDWGYATEYVEAMWLMLQQGEPEDYLIATGVTHSVKELVQIAFSHAGLDWQKHVVFDEKLYRPAEIHELRGDFTKARSKLGWKPRVSFEELIKMMVDSDLEKLRK